MTGATLVNPWTWAILALVLAGIEILAPGAFMIWLAGAAVLTALVGAATGIAWEWQVAVFAVAAAGLVLASRRFARGGIQDRTPGVNDRTAALLGERVVVSVAIREGRGRVRLGDGEWGARGPDADVGAVLRVAAVEGTTLVVETP